MPDTEEIYLVSCMYFAVYLWLSPYLLPKYVYLMFCDILWSFWLLQTLTFQTQKAAGRCRKSPAFHSPGRFEEICMFQTWKFMTKSWQTSYKWSNIQTFFTGCLLATSTGAIHFTKEHQSIPQFSSFNWKISSFKLSKVPGHSSSMVRKKLPALNGFFVTFVRGRSTTKLLKSCWERVQCINDASLPTASLGFWPPSHKTYSFLWNRDPWSRVTRSGRRTVLTMLTVTPAFWDQHIVKSSSSSSFHKRRKSKGLNLIKFD